MFAFRVPEVRYMVIIYAHKVWSGFVIAFGVFLKDWHSPVDHFGSADAWVPKLT